MRPRRQARILVLHALFQMELGGNSLEEAVATIRREAEDRDTLNFVEEKVRPEVLDFFETLVRGVWSAREELDGLVEQRSHNWSLERLNRVDRNLLRMGAYELLHRPDIPASATINEALELARLYGDDKSASFVNALLDSIHRTAGAASE